MAIDKARADQRKSERGGGRFKFKKGTNKYRIFPFTHKVTKADVAAGLFEEKSLGKVEQEFDRLVIIQYGVKKRPIVATEETLARYEKLAASKSDVDQKNAHNMRPQRKYAVNLVDVDARPLKLVQALIPVSVDADIWDEWTAKQADDYTVDDIFGPKGRDFITTYNSEAKSPQDYYKTSLRDKEKSAKLPKDLLESVVDLYAEGWEDALGLEVLGGSEEETSLDSDENKDEGEEEDEDEEEETDEEDED